MTKRMLIDASHPEETRVAVISGNRLEEFDFETSSKQQLKGNIYLAKVTRVEPSLQAAFVDYGGARHGFLAFGEIHPDYYRIPVADREAILAAEREAAAAEAEADAEADREAERYGDSGRSGAGDGHGAARPGRPPREVTAAIPPDDANRVTEDPAENAAAADPGGDGPSEPPAPVAADGDQPPAEDAAGTSGDGNTHAPAAAGPHEASGGTSEAAGLAPAEGAAPGEPAPEEPDAAIAHGHTREAVAASGGAPENEGSGAGFDDAADDGAPDTGAEFAETALPEAAGAVDGTGVFDDTADEDEAENGDEAEVDEDDAEDAGSGEAREQGFAPESAEVGPGQAGTAVLPIAQPRGQSERIETVGGDAAAEVEDVVAQRPSRRPLRSYKIQEVTKRRQIMLVQVTKEERGTKGAALTTYLSLAGRYCVLMPNTPRGGGISRKIASPKDRKRMKSILDDLAVPEGMAVILRTAGLERTKTEIRRDFDYLLRLWDMIREQTLQSTAPCVIHEEASLIKRAIRDLYARDIDEVWVAGEHGYRMAKDFMRMLMPSHAKKVQHYRDPVPLFHRYQVETQIDALHSPSVQLRSGGYVVINPTEALVAIDVNSGRSTRERNIEETAYKTNLEAAEEIARQLRLRDLAGLIVIDFIDMEDDKHIAAVERRLKEAMRVDRARIQVGRISAFGLLELSRQRLRPSFVETHFQTCPACRGLGLVRSLSSSALHVLRAIEEEGIRRRASEIAVYVPAEIALYILNQKRDALADIEARYRLRVLVDRDDALVPPDFRLERLRDRDEDEEAAEPVIDTAARLMAETDAAMASEAAEAEAEAAEEDEAPAPAPAAALRAADPAPESGPRGRRSRRSRNGRPEREARPAAARAEEPKPSALAEPAESDDDDAAAGESGAAPEGSGDAAADEQTRKRRRRGKRGGRRRAATRSPEGASLDESAAAESEAGAEDETAADAETPEGEDLEGGGEVVGGEPRPRRGRSDGRGRSRRFGRREGRSGSAAAGAPVAEPWEPGEPVDAEVFPPEPSAVRRAAPAEPSAERAAEAVSDPAAEYGAAPDAEAAAPALDLTPAGNEPEPSATEAEPAAADEAVPLPAEAEASDSVRPEPDLPEPDLPEPAQAASFEAGQPEPEPVPEAVAPDEGSRIEPEPAPIEPAPIEAEPEPAEREPAMAEPPAHATHEVVNRPPERPRRGWWQRFMEGN